MEANKKSDKSFVISWIVINLISFYLIAIITGRLRYFISLILNLEHEWFLAMPSILLGLCYAILMPFIISKILKSFDFKFSFIK
jgi:hypothetical protein